MKIKLGRFEYTIIKQPHLKSKDTVSYDDDFEPDALDRNLFGAVNSGKGFIFLDSAMTPAYERDTLVHEIIHAMMDMTALRTSFLNEEIASSLAPVMVDFICNNPEVIEYIKDLSIVLPNHTVFSVDKETKEDGH